MTRPALASTGDVGIDGVPITPSDSTTFEPSLRALYVGTGGDVALRTPAGNTLTFKNIPDGGYVLCRCDRVLDTNTSAQDIVGLY